MNSTHGMIKAQIEEEMLVTYGEDFTDDVVTEMMNLADTDGDGKVNFDEFCKAAT